MPKPPNARTFIDPPTRSDGKNGEKILKKKGLEIVNQDQLKYLAYFKTLGEGLTQQEGTALACLPAGYALGRKNDHKVLTGHPSGRHYTTSKLFLPHLKWLFTSGEDPCQCKLCNGSKRTRRASNKKPDDDGDGQQSMKDQQQQRRSLRLEEEEEHESQKRIRQRIRRRRRQRQLKYEGIYGPLRPMDKVLIKIPHENDLPIPGCISIPTLVPVPNIEEKLRPQHWPCQADSMM